MNQVKVNTTETWLIDGAVWKNVHAEDSCMGTYCTVHNPSSHHMLDWKLTGFYVGERLLVLAVRICEHGSYHADPDSLAWVEEMLPEWKNWIDDACDGCCVV